MTTVAYKREHVGWTRLQIEDAMGCEQSIDSYEDDMMARLTNWRWKDGTVFVYKRQRYSEFNHKLDDNSGTQTWTSWMSTVTNWRCYGLWTKYRQLWRWHDGTVDKLKMKIWHGVGVQVTKVFRIQSQVGWQQWHTHVNKLPHGWWHGNVRTNQTKGIVLEHNLDTQYTSWMRRNKKKEPSKWGGFK